MISNNELRQDLKKKRSSLTKQQQQDAGAAVCTQVLSFIDIKNIKHIAAYIPCNGEISPIPLLEKLHDNNLFCYLPILDTQQHNHLKFMRWTPGVEMKKNRFGIPEPKIDHLTECKKNKLDIVILPLVGFDANCNRLGMGGGYYDRSFSFKNDLTVKNKPLLIGVAHNIQQCSELNVESWDVQLDAIITPNKIYTKVT